MKQREREREREREHAPFRCILVQILIILSFRIIKSIGDWEKWGFAESSFAGGRNTDFRVLRSSKNDTLCLWAFKIFHFGLMNRSCYSYSILICNTPTLFYFYLFYSYLFILVAEGLSTLIHKTVYRGDIHGVQVC